MVDIAKVRDIALTVEPDNELLAHLPECPMVSQHRMQGRYIATMMGMGVPLTGDEAKDKVRLHTCLKPKPTSP